MIYSQQTFYVKTLPVSQEVKQECWVMRKSLADAIKKHRKMFRENEEVFLTTHWSGYILGLRHQLMSAQQVISGVLMERDIYKEKLDVYKW